LFWGNRFVESFSPYGVVLVIAPWNYPLQLSLVPVVSALLAGNAVILKPSEHSPLTAQAIRGVFEKIGFPKGVFQVVEGDGQLASDLIDAKPDQVFFTGSERVGKNIAEKCASLFIPVMLELGGKDAMIVREDAHLERAAKGACYGAFLNSGQVCVGVKRVFVHESVASRFLELFKAEVSSLRIGSSTDSDLGPLKQSEQVKRLALLTREAIDGGAKAETPLKVEGAFFYPLVLSNVPEHSELLTEETFGPLVCVTPFKSDHEAVRFANRSRFGLGSSVWSRDLRKARLIADALIVGSCSINNVVVQIANPAAPFGGEKHSGVGRYHGEEGLLAFSRRKTILMNRGRRKSEINWFPFTSQTFNGLKRFLSFRHRSGFGLLMLILCSALRFSPATLAHSADAPQAELVVHVFGVSPKLGSLRYLLFQSEEGFPRDKSKSFRAGSQKISSVGEQVIPIAGVPFGTYAVSVYQDENENGKLDTNFWGIPKEPVGASNDPKSRMGPPRYSDSKFMIQNPEVQIAIHLVSPQ
jgi:acyl-CoA reductase-like NAD-dependent aldehyde dehydrogenase/uncharacterized protein (DUF2141 family)